MMPRRTRTGWRRVIAGVLAYAVALQGFIFALDLGHPAIAAADAANATAWAGFELCTHGGAAPPGAPAQAPVGDMHCPFCIAGAVFVNCAPPSALQYSTVVLTVVVWPTTVPQLRALFMSESAWPRGPPAAAWPAGVTPPLGRA